MSDDNGSGAPTVTTSASALKGICGIVAIGASAGAQEPLEQLFTAMPHDCGLTFVVIMHLPAEGPSLLADFLSRFTRMAVVTAEEGMSLRPDTVHVIPAGRDLTVSGGLIRLEGPDGTHHPIDRLFRSLAVEMKENTIAVILSGFGTDGAQGVRMLREAGGIVMVQEPATALNPGMPQSAISSGVADFILPTEQMPGKISEIVRGTCALPPRACLTTTIDEELAAIFSAVKARTGHDFSSYKRNTVMRRIERRMAVNEVGGLRKYVALLEQNPQEAHALSQDILIGVTSFFRDPEAFETIRKEVIPRLFANRDPDDPVRIWHACCATGEEVYSMAILVREYLDAQGLSFKVQFFASDIDEAAIAQARSGLYPDDIRADVGQERLETFFTRIDSRWQIKKSLREMVVFAHHSLIKDPPFSRLDLLVCRNFLIYLNPDMQKRLITLFHQILKPGGILFLGGSETVGRQTDLFKALDKKCKIFSRRESERKIETIFPFSTSVRMPVPHRPVRPPVLGEPGPGPIVEKLLLERHAPPCVVVNEKYEVIYVSRRMSRFLEVPVGEPTRDILKMAREELRPSLRAAIYKSIAEQKPVVFRGVKVAVEGVESSVNMQVEPLNAPPAGRLAMIVFESPLPAAAAVPDEAGEGAQRDETSREMLIRQMEEQLRITHEQLQTTTEQLETSNEGFMSVNEELISINEEFQSTNEELQSTNEELETSKEELQALNEELITVNSELQGKVEELNLANSDMENLLTSSEIVAIFLNRQLNIMRFTPAVAPIFNMIPADIGRPFRHLAGKIDWPTLSADAEKVLAGGLSAEREVTTLEEGRCHILRVLPYRNAERVIDGIVISFVDITEHKRLEERTRHLASFPQLNPNPILELDLSGKIIYCNPAALTLVESCGMEKNDCTSFLPADLDAILRELTENKRVSVYREVDIGERVFGLTLHLISQFGLVRLYTIDVTERKRAELEREASIEFLRMVNESTSTPELIAAAVGFFKRQSGCEAVGIRLREGDDYPYFETHGFPLEFVQLENSLCSRDCSGDLIRDDTGNPVIDCMCGNVICGRFDPSKPFFTAKGSFWSNCTTDLLATTSEADRQARTRNRCNGEGYESVALIPLRLGTEQLGLLQLNDRRRGCFTSELIALWERLTDYLVVALAKFRVDEELRRAKEEWERTFNSVPDLIAILDDRHRIVRVNRAMAQRLGLQPEECVELPCYAAIHGTEAPPACCPHTMTLDDCLEHEAEVHEDKLGGDFLVSTTPLLDNEGKLTGAVHVARDITDRKRAEAEILRRVEELHATNTELERFNSASVGRELRMIELKKEINELRLKAGLAPGYPLEFEEL